MPSLCGRVRDIRLCVILTTTILVGGAYAQSRTPTKGAPPIPQAPVVVDKRVLFLVKGVLSFPAEARASAISKRITEISKDFSFKPESLSVTDTAAATDIAANDVVVMSVTDEDAALAGKPRQELANDYAQRIRAEIVALWKDYILGLLLSLGSSSAVANAVAGVILTYMRAFKLGDRVKIADTMGDVIEKTLLVTRIRTIKNVDITIANSMVMGAHIIIQCLKRSIRVDPTYLRNHWARCPLEESTRTAHQRSARDQSHLEGSAAIHIADCA